MKHPGQFQRQCNIYQYRTIYPGCCRANPTGCGKRPTPTSGGCFLPGAEQAHGPKGAFAIQFGLIFPRSEVAIVTHAPSVRAKRLLLMRGLRKSMGDSFLHSLTHLRRIVLPTAMPKSGHWRKFNYCYSSGTFFGVLNVYPGLHACLLYNAYPYFLYDNYSANTYTTNGL